jgi:hypothetical protein
MPLGCAPWRVEKTVVPWELFHSEKSEFFGGGSGVVVHEGLEVGLDAVLDGLGGEGRVFPAFGASCGRSKVHR